MARKGISRRPWSEQEKETCGRLYAAGATVEEMMSALPGRSMEAIRNRVKELRRQSTTITHGIDSMLEASNGFCRTLQERMAIIGTEPRYVEEIERDAAAGRCRFADSCRRRRAECRRNLPRLDPVRGYCNVGISAKSDKARKRCALEE